MIDILLVIIIIILLISTMGFVYLKDKQHDKQINQLIKAIISKNPQDYRDLTLAENTKIEANPETGNVQNDFVPMSDATPEMFDKMIKNQLNDEDSYLDES